jgi:S1-C subfamily serine protease
MPTATDDRSRSGWLAFAGFLVIVLAMAWLASSWIHAPAVDRQAALVSTSSTGAASAPPAAARAPATSKSEAGARVDVPQSASPLLAEEQANRDVYRIGSKSLVHITSLAQETDDDSDEQDVRVGTGSGFIWDQQGHIVTNFHVVEGAESVRVILPNHKAYSAQQVATFPDADIAVVRIAAPAEQLHPVSLGTSHDLHVGQIVFAFGCPYGLDQTMTKGIVSAVGREIRSRNGGLMAGIIQTSAAINPGNSGGMLLDRSGRLIGMNTAILSNSGAFAGIGFAIPVDEIRQVVPELIKHGKIVRPQLGVLIASRDLAERLGVDDGVLIARVVPHSPAANAGLRGTRLDADGNLQLGDVIVGFDGHAVHSATDFYDNLDREQKGQPIEIQAVRDGKPLAVKVTPK